MNRKIVAGFVAALVLTLAVLFGHHEYATAAPARPVTAPASKVQYVASSVRLPFHRPDCKWAGKISPKNLQVFETREEAIAAGHRPCKVCQP
jgi:hypothetical protein